jgi:methylglyoxal synthase
MAKKELKMARRKHLALVAHDNKKDDMVAWAIRHRELLSKHVLYATGTTGSVLAREVDLDIIKLQSGPLGGDQQIGARISEDEINILIFFWDPLEAQPHDPDVKALLRMATVWNIPVATTLASADFMITSPFMDSDYTRMLPDFEEYRERMRGLKIGG